MDLQLDSTVGGASAAVMFQHFNCASQVLPSQQSLRQPFCGPAMKTSPALGKHDADETVGSAVPWHIGPAVRLRLVTGSASCLQSSIWSFRSLFIYDHLCEAPSTWIVYDCFLCSTLKKCLRGSLSLYFVRPKFNHFPPHQIDHYLCFDTGWLVLFL